MPLPGKLCIGILEEDNPLKSHFRFKPLLIEQDGQYVPYTETDCYPDEGCLRIVPDKNESSHFKTRMRRIGRFAVVDLTKHPGENDKIRANKNYTPGGPEQNASIIYSDVVRELAADTIFCIFDLDPKDAEHTSLPDAVYTSRAMLRNNGELLPDTWNIIPAEGEDSAVHLTSDGKTVDIEKLQTFDLAGFGGVTLSFALFPPTKVEHVPEVPAPRAPKPVHIEEEEQIPATVEKPWIAREAPVTTPPSPTPVLTPAQQAQVAQVGLNPRRGRCLQEIIDDKWRHSRIEQLGHPVPPSATGYPMDTPVESAAKLVRDVWEQPNLRIDLLKALATINSLDSAMEACRMTAQEQVIHEHLNELEAQRLKMLADLDVLKRKNYTLRETLKQEIRQDEADAFAEAVRKTEQAKAECAHHEEIAARAKCAAESAEDALNALNDGRFEQRLNEFAITSRAVEMIRGMGSSATAPAMEGTSIDSETLILRTMECFADAGHAIDRNSAINLLICAAQSPFLLLSGPSGSGKSTVVRLLARALGIEKGHYAEFAPSQNALADDAHITALCKGSAVSLALLDDANLNRTSDMTRGLTPLAECGRLLVCATLQDSNYGQPVPAMMFDRAFMIRLPEESENTAWQPKPTVPAKSYAPVSFEALRAAFVPQPEAIPEMQCHRLEKLRTELAVLDVRLSRRTLDALWNYCATAIPLMQLEPSAVLDLALAQRALPAILAGAPLPALAALPKFLEDLPCCKALLNQPLPIFI